MYQRGVPCDVVSTRTSPGLSAAALRHPAEGRAGNDAGCTVVDVGCGLFAGLPAAWDELEHAAVATPTSSATEVTDILVMVGRRTAGDPTRPPRTDARGDGRISIRA